jgi:hypothetical protein
MNISEIADRAMSLTAWPPNISSSRLGRGARCADFWGYSGWRCIAAVPLNITDRWGENMIDLRYAICDFHFISACDIIAEMCRVFGYQCMEDALHAIRPTLCDNVACQIPATRYINGKPLCE